MASKPRRRAVVIAALGSGVAVASMDTLSGLLSGGYWSTLAMVSSAAAALVSCVLLSLVLGLLVLEWYRRSEASSRGVLEVSVAVLLTTVFASLAVLRHAPRFDWKLRTLLEVVACAGPILVLLATALAARRKQLGTWLGHLARVAPFWLAATVLFVWVRSHPGGLPPFSVAQGFLLYFALLGVSAILVFGPRRRAVADRALVALAVAIAIAPAAVLLIEEVERPAAASGGTGPHIVERVVLITVDTLRADVVDRDTTPNIHRLSRDGLVFENAISPAPWTVPAVASLMTGLSPDVHRGTHLRWELSSGIETLAERLRDAGYRTAAIGKNAALLADRKLDQGFLRYDFYPRPSGLKSFGANLLMLIRWGEFRPDASDDDITKLALEWVRRNRASDFFLWVHYFGPHGPYTPPPEFQPSGTPPPEMSSAFSKLGAVRLGTFTPSLEQRDWIRELYRGEAASTDRSVGNFIVGLRDLGLYDDALIVFTADHGEEFWEHEGLGHSHTLYRELLEVPLILKVPGIPPAEVEQVVSTQRVMATVLAACGLDYDERILAPAIPLEEDARARLESESVVSTSPLHFEDRIAVRLGRFWYIHSLLSDREELYDMEQDPEQKHSIASSAPEKLREARDLIGTWRERMADLRSVYRTGEDKPVPLKPGTEDHLRALGYVH